MRCCKSEDAAKVNPCVVLIGTMSERASSHMTSAIHSDLVPRQLTTGVGAPVLVVDFVPLSAGASLSSLLGAKSRGHPVYAIDPVSDLVQVREYLREYLSVADMAAAYAEGFVDAHPRVFVVGYCSAAPLALHIARILAVGRDVSVALVRPVWPDEGEIASEFAALRKGLGVGDSLRLGSLCVDAKGDPEQALAEMTEILHGDLVSMATSRGLDASSAVLIELLNRYRAWLAFLLAGQHAGPVGRTAIDVYTGTGTNTGTTPDAISPEFGLETCRFNRLPILDQEPFATPELVDLLLVQFEAEEPT